MPRLCTNGAKGTILRLPIAESLRQGGARPVTLEGFVSLTTHDKSFKWTLTMVWRSAVAEVSFRPLTWVQAWCSRTWEGESVAPLRFWCCVLVCDHRENESHEHHKWMYDPGKEETAHFVKVENWPPPYRSIYPHLMNSEDLVKISFNLEKINWVYTAAALYFIYNLS